MTNEIRINSRKKYWRLLVSFDDLYTNQVYYKIKVYYENEQYLSFLGFSIAQNWELELETYTKYTGVKIKEMFVYKYKYINISIII